MPVGRGKSATAAVEKVDKARRITVVARDFIGAILWDWKSVKSDFGRMEMCRG